MSQLPPPDIQRQMRQSRRLSRSNSGTFHYAFYLFPRHKRDALHVIYRFCRKVDDAVDSQAPEEDKIASLNTIRDNLLNGARGEPWEPLSWIQTQYRIPNQYFEDLIRGARRDIGSVRVRTLPGLLDYCYCVAGTVGLITLHVMGFRTRHAFPYSLAMGHAFQLTNILRDVEEDRARDRCYIPQSVLKRHEAVDDWEKGRYSSNLRDALADIAHRARLYYRESLPLFEMVDRDARLPLALMTSAYSWYLRLIEDHDYDVSSKTIRLTAGDLPSLFWNSLKASRGRAEHCLMIS